MVTTWLLVTDVDDTLVGDEAALARLAAVVTPSLRIVLNSSRPVDSVAAGLDLPPSLVCDGIIGALGTEITYRGEHLGAWSAQFAGFDRRRYDDVLDPLGSPHRDEYQTPAKVSYDIDPARWDEAAAAVNTVGAPVRVITSGTSSFDVIPAEAGKAAALRHVAAIAGVPPERVIAAGDSENDADMLAAANGIVVGNATAALRRTVPDAYPARGFRADGIVEGLAHYGVPLTTAGPLDGIPQEVR